ncbi:MAG: carboxypeptidase-like regulatory domain-containing protein [Prolixibacteraceae bacterium]
MKIKSFYALLLLFLLSSLTYGQIQVQGRVLDYNGKPLSGVAISVEKTTVSTFSGIDGEYQINVPGIGSAIFFKYVNRKTEKRSVEKDDNGVCQLDDVVYELLLLEKSITGIQLGAGFNIYNEFCLAEPIVLRTQLDVSASPLVYDVKGIEFTTINSFVSSLVDYSLIVPFNLSFQIKVYDLPWKNYDGLNMSRGNTGGYFSLSLTYAPYLMSLFLDETSMGLFDYRYELTQKNMFFLMPGLGYRHGFGKNFNYEMRCGLGSNLNDLVFSATDASFLNGSKNFDGDLTSGSGLIFNFSLRLGYDFKVVRQ